eukprot:CAMPEP_0202948972 /NCGR_PEP_ID=MMETSP1395-20130829/14820_1 /ASSEMBLY_ACC=CAM_ASM_000871 /TAXON_ID=5961 /ORGANISM="Blepharisma japonicum, Strain Stock R1072" /LENGTH=59 /DNA_ID=CAMNT_0049651573 /DNA_START=125 /DNA_END=304 /DNA_ORIENTATION=+
MTKQMVFITSTLAIMGIIAQPCSLRNLPIAQGRFLLRHIKDWQVNLVFMTKTAIQIALA